MGEGWGKVSPGGLRELQGALTESIVPSGAVGLGHQHLGEFQL